VDDARLHQRSSRLRRSTPESPPPFVALGSRGTATKQPIEPILLGVVLFDRSQYLRSDGVEPNAHVREHLGGHAFDFAEQSQEQVLRANVLLPKTSCFFDGVLDDLLGARRMWPPSRGDHFGAELNDLHDFISDPVEIDAEVLQDAAGDARVFPEKTEQYLF